MLCTATKSEMAQMGLEWIPNPCRLGGPQCSSRTKSEMAHMWAQWLPHPYRLWGPQCSSRGQNHKMAHMWSHWLPTPCHLRGPQCSARGQNQKWPPCGHSGYLPLAASGVPNALHGDKIRNGPHVGTVATYPLPSWGSPMLCTGTKSEMAHM